MVLVHVACWHAEGLGWIGLELAVRVQFGLVGLAGECLADLRLNLIVDTIYRRHRLISTYRL